MSQSGRIWYQSFVDPQSQRPYMTRLQDRLIQITAPQVSVEVHGISPPDRFLSPVTEFRCAAHAIRNAIRAEQTGFNAYVIGHFQEPGLIESRCAVDIPVMGLGEAAMLYACTLGRTFGLVTINPCFIPWHRDQIARLGLGQRAVGVRAVNTEVATYMEAFEVETAYERVKEQFAAEAHSLVEAGAEVIIPAGGLPMLLLERETGWTVNGAVVLNGIAAVMTMAEAALKYKQHTGVSVSRKGAFAKAPAEAIQEFLESQGATRNAGN